MDFVISKFEQGTVGLICLCSRLSRILTGNAWRLRVTSLMAEGWHHDGSFIHRYSTWAEMTKILGLAGAQLGALTFPLSMSLVLPPAPYRVVRGSVPGDMWRMSVPRKGRRKYMTSVYNSPLLVAIIIPFRGVSQNLKICFKTALKLSYYIPEIWKRSGGEIWVAKRTQGRKRKNKRKRGGSFLHSWLFLANESPSKVLTASTPVRLGSFTSALSWLLSLRSLLSACFHCYPSNPSEVILQWQLSAGIHSVYHHLWLHLFLVITASFPGVWQSYKALCWEGPLIWFNFLLSSSGYS